MVHLTNPVLVAYATLSGSTAEVAEAVAATIRECGLTADVKSIRDVESLEPYGPVVVGAPLYMFRWIRPARRFVVKNRAGLAKRPCAIFALGPFHDVKKEWLEVRAQLDKEVARFPWLSPISVIVFGGKFDPKKLTFPYNLIMPLMHLPESDIRNWDEIRVWAGNLAREFKARMQQPGQ
jgi:menaquinone-dependent protoporphyrinogen oxidase